MNPTHLEEAFGLLLGRPLRDYPSNPTYELFHWDTFLKWDDTREASALRGLFRFEDDELPLGRFVFDLSASLFGFAAEGLDALDDTIADRLRQAGREYEGEIWIRGEDLAPIAAKAQEIDWEELVIIAKAKTDGTLFDAMAHATRQHDEEARLELDNMEDIESSLAVELARISDPRLRHHMRVLSQTEQAARTTGAQMFGLDYPLSVLVDVFGRDPVLGWSAGEGGSVGFAVVRTAPDPSTLR